MRADPAHRARRRRGPLTEERRRGLLAVKQSQERRAAGKREPIPLRFLFWVATACAVWAILYWKSTQGEIASAKAKIVARQRGIAAELAPRFVPLREEIEAWTMQAAAGPWPGDLVDPEARRWDFQSVPGIYLRLLATDATSAKAIRKAAQSSLRDAFTACLFHEPNPDPGSGPPCKATHECAQGTFCNEMEHCAAPAQPYNMRAAYRGTHVLTDEWSVELKSATDDMQMRLLQRAFDGYVNDDVPLVIDLLARAQFFMLVLDEPPAGAAVAGRPPDLEEVQKAPHAARALLWSIRGHGHKLLLRVRREIDARFQPVGGTSITDPRVLDSQQRQVNSCQLALFVRQALGQTEAAATPP